MSYSTIQFAVQTRDESVINMASILVQHLDSKDKNQVILCSVKSHLQEELTLYFPGSNLYYEENEFILAVAPLLRAKSEKTMNAVIKRANERKANWPI